MPLNPVTVEQVTALTNIPLGLIAMFATIRLWNWRPLQPLKATIWAGMFGCLMVASDLAIFVHGFELEPETSKLIWHVIKAALALTVACFVAGAVFDRWGADTTWRVAPGLLALSAGFFSYATFVSKTFLPFIVYESVAMLFCLAVFLSLAVQRRLPGAGWMVAGVAITILAAVLQAMPRVEFQLGVTFDHNGVFHLVQLPGLLCLLRGVLVGLGPRPAREPVANGLLPSAAKST
jgi:hypothetical protein